MLEPIRVPSRLISGFALALLLAAPGCPAPDPVPAGPAEEVIRFNSLGTAYLGQQKWADALTAFGRATELAPDEPLPLNNMAVALVQQGEVERAQASLEQALELAPDNLYAHYNLGLIFKNRGEFESAAEHFEAVAAVDPEDLLTQYNLGIVLSRIGRDDQAKQAFERALQRDPTHVSTLYGLGQFLLRRGEEERGRELVTRSAEIRARSGLDAAVGSQYGEQGPYAMGADYPGDALPAPEALEVRFETLARGELEHRPELGSPAWTVTSLPGEAAPALLVADGSRLRRLGPGGWSALPAPALEGTLAALAAADVDNDGTAEIAALVRHGERLEPALLRLGRDVGADWAEDTEAFGDAAGRPLDGEALQADLTAVDSDHDGDIDLFWCWSNADRTDCALGTNDGGGRFSVQGSSEHGFSPSGGPVGPVSVAFSDYDNDRDIDLLLAEPGGIHVYSNQRDGTFEDVADRVGLGAEPGAGSLVVTDLNKDGWMDLVVGGAGGVGLRINRRGRFEPGARFGSAADASTRVVALDLDNDGFIDLARSRPGSAAQIFRNEGSGSWSEPGALLGDAARNDGAQPLVAFDADADGDLDLALFDPAGAVVLLANAGGNARSWITIRSHGMGDNRFGIGAKVEVLAGALRQKFEVTSPVPLHAGLGDRPQVESVRYLWPSGVLQDEIELPAGDATEVTQLDRKGTSCPLLYAWGEDGWRFVTDFLGGAAVGSQLARGVFNTPDTDEYVKIEGGITPAAGVLRLRINNQLEEVLWFDQVELLAVDHPAGTEVFPNERLMPGPPWPEFALFASSDVRPLAAARGVENGRDLAPELSAADGVWVRNFELLPFKGYASSHTVELDLGAFDDRERIVLLLDGWIDYADSSSNIAAEQAGVRLLPPRLTVADGRGGWRRTGHRMGFPAGLPKTMSVELTGLFEGDDHRVRIETNMRIYWDRARLLVGGAETPLRVQRLKPSGAELRFGGFPRADRRGPTPLSYDANDVHPTSSWKAHVGSYTPFGDVREPLAVLDDRFVTTRNGDEVELSFIAPAAPAPGWTRTYVLFADGFGKDMDPNSAASSAVGPIPFHGMPGYPYPDDVVPPRTAAAEGRRVLPSPLGLPGVPPQSLAARLDE